MPGVTPPPDESAKLPLPAPGTAETLPAPGSSGVTVEPTRPADDGYDGEVPIVTEVVESPPVLPTGAGYAALTEPVDENGVGALGAGAVEFIEVGPISVVLKGVSALLPDGADSYDAPGFSGPGGAEGPL